MSRRTIIIVSIIVIVFVAGLIGYSLWNKPFKNPLNGDAVKTTATQLLIDFKTNEIAARDKYVPSSPGNKIVEVSGNIKEAGKNENGETYYYLQTGDEMSGVKCVMDKGSEIPNAAAGLPVTIRGFCDGLKKDTLMDIVIMDIIVNRCKPVNK